MNIDKCVWCGSNELIEVAKRKDTLSVNKCNICGLYFLKDVPADFEKYYSGKEYFRGDDVSDIGYAEVYDLISPLFIYWQSVLLNNIVQNYEYPNTLEIGCATGNLLEVMKEKNIKGITKGIDISKYASEVAQKKGLNVDNITIEDFFDEKKYDIIFSSETMEHVLDLKAYLGGIKRNLSLNGSFIFYIPSIKDVLVEKLGNNYGQFQMNMEHLLFFTKKFLEVEFKKFFECDIFIHEYDRGDDSCIVGIVSRDSSKVAKTNKILAYLNKESVDEEMSKSLSKQELYDMAIIASKFYNSTLAKNVLNKLENGINLNEKLFLKGIICYQKGELYEAKKAFLKSLENEFLTNVDLKLLYAVEKDIAKYLENKNAEAEERIIEKENQIIDLRSEISKLHDSRIVRVSFLLNRLFNSVLRRKNHNGND